MPFVLGIDPDTKTTGWAVASEDRVLSVGIVKSREMLRATAAFLESFFNKSRSASPVELVVVEGQRIYPYAKQKPNDILKLGQVGGGILGQAIALCPSMKTVMPEPEEWKGQRPKEVHQASVYEHYGIQHSRASGYSYPSGCSKAVAISGYSRLNQGDWKHVGDAIGLALWGIRTLKSGR